MQITQFVLGTNMAAAYLFVHYTIPYSAANAALRNLTQAVPAVAHATTEAGVMPWLKKLAFRAAGAEGIAENVGGAVTAPPAGYTQQMVTCMDTTGQAFAIWLNVSYLLPLTYLFARFFVRSYLQRKDPGDKQPTHMEAAEKAGVEAFGRLSREIQRAAIEGENSETTDDEVIRAQVQKIVEQKTQASPVRTRASAANKAQTAASSGSNDGFSTVKKGAKKQTKAEQKINFGSPTGQGENPFGVLDRNA
ncbi:uncharacterized protein N7477_002148 [Penicillium maclennaniae]|uniref:uncharacterized protein n=1 Tax=Penicillium maclennaniae TaxID=1343394 RepID=UPI0025422E74|nr:uncharacterized protein N7477_002148 [Penicillium maclennaniae]KAJ5676515.1 hypothetical protein N7477_002148 [Penicillium maclennaniae]